jgi:acetylornithine deacetylase/succinyl-diaminopimelate desuccinylase-like protein
VTVGARRRSFEGARARWNSRSSAAQWQSLRFSGEPQQAHQTDEYCSMQRIRQSVAIYEELTRDWCGI